MLVTGLWPLRVKLENGSIGNVQLTGQGFNHRPRDSQRICQKPAHDTNRDQLDSESQTVVHSPTATTTGRSASSNQ